MLGLNAGCGRLATAPAALTHTASTIAWLQYDLHSWMVHLNGDVRRLPFKDDAFDVVHCSHVIEHVDEADAIPTLKEFRRVLRPDGYIYIAAPDVPRAREAGSDWWSVVGDVGARMPGWDHQWACSVPKLRYLMSAAGFVPTWASGVPQNHPPRTNSWPNDFEVRFLARPKGFRWSRYFPQAAASVAIADIPGAA